MTLHVATPGAAGEWGGSITDNAYIPTLFAKKLEALLYTNTVYDKITNTNFEGQIKSFGDIVKVRIRPSVNVTEYTTEQQVQYREGTEWELETSRDLQIDQGAKWSVGLFDENAAQTDIKNWLSEASADASENTQIYIDNNVLNYLCNPANHDADNKGQFAGKISGDGTTVGVDLGDTGIGEAEPITGGSTGNAHEMLVYMSQVLSEQDVPMQGRWVVLPYWYISRLQLGDLKRADVTNDPTGMIRKGFSGQVAGLDIYESNQIPSTATATYLTEANNYAIPFGVNDACTFAMQVNKSEKLRLQDYFQDVMRGLCVFGRELIFPERAGVAIVTPG